MTAESFQIIVGPSAIEEPEPLANTGLTVRAVHILESIGIETVPQALAMTPDQLLAVGRHQYGNARMVHEVAMLIQRRTGRDPWEETP